VYGRESIGKLTAVLRWATARNYKPEDIVVVRFSKYTTVDELFGGDYANMDPKIEAKFVFREGPVSNAVRLGRLLVLVEFD